MTLYDYSLHASKGWMGDPKRGAAMGRGSWINEGPNYSGPIRIQEVKLDAGGYDPSGAYFGHSPDRLLLYWVASPSCSIDYVQWAGSRSEVEFEVRKKWPLAQVRKTSIGQNRRRRRRLAPVSA